MHDRAIYGQYNSAYSSVSGGHVWQGQLPPRPANLSPRFGSGQITDPPTHPSHYWANGVYEQPNAKIQGPGRPALPKPDPHTSFPLGLSPTQVQNLGNRAWNGGKPFYGIDPATGRWDGFALLPNRQPIGISGTAKNDIVYHYYPSGRQ
ncbi:hypothetical protein ACFXGA_25920 [Actinosynnema sp. NPDC059335]|uniref:hypothetical protein n=1 Tax=Actinosynnema sp. NPDC059335 TaxID=3346804 RepID=UPI003671041B